MNISKITQLFSKGNKKSKVAELLNDMPSYISKQVDTPQGNSWITKAEAREAKKNFGKERKNSQDPNDKILLAELDDIILGNVKGIEPSEEILGKGWKEFAQAGNKFEGDLKAYPLRFAGDELDREMFQRKYINSYDSWATKKEDQVSDWYNNTEEGKRFQLENFGQIMTPLKDMSMMKKTTKKGDLTELEIMRKLKTENTSDITLDDIDRYDFAEGGEAFDMSEKSPMNSQMGDLMGAPTRPDETIALPGNTQEEYDSSQEGLQPDEEMEEDYVDFVVGQALSPEEQEFLNTELESNNALSMIFDKVIEVAAEFSGEGPVDGPGTGISDSIPARLSDGEFVFTAEAVRVIGVDKLEELMEAAEAQNNERLMAYEGGPIKEEKEVMAAPQEPQQQNINVTKTTLDNGAAMSRQQEDLVGKAVKENMMLDPYQRHVRS
jgi:hypothetical protein